MRHLSPWILAVLLSSCAASSINHEQVARTPRSHALAPEYLSGDLSSRNEEGIRRNLSRGSGFVFGERLLFESDAYQTRQGLKPHPGTCFLFEVDATENPELEPETWELTLGDLSGARTLPLRLTLQEGTADRLKTDKLPFTIRGRACTPERLNYPEGFQVTVRRTDAKPPKTPKTTVYQWTPWKEGLSRDLDRKRW